MKGLTLRRNYFERLERPIRSAGIVGQFISQSKYRRQSSITHLTIQYVVFNGQPTDGIPTAINASPVGLGDSPDRLSFHHVLTHQNAQAVHYRLQFLFMFSPTIKVTDVVEVNCHQQDIDLVRLEMWITVFGITKQVARSPNYSVYVLWTMIGQKTVIVQERSLLDLRMNFIPKVL